MNYDVERLRREEFPISERYAYFNHCGISPTPQRSVAAAEAFIRDVTLHGTAGFMAWLECFERTRAKLASLINVAPDELAFVKNTSEGLNIVAQAVPWQAGDVILVAEGEFPANIYPWQQLERLGVELAIVPAPDERITPELFAPFLQNHNVRMIALSWVQFHTGWRADLAAMSKLCSDAGVLLCLDAIQGLGGLPLDLQATPVDFCTFGGNKWMLSLQGAGGLYVNRRVRDQLQPANVGWLSVAWEGVESLDPTRPVMEAAAQYEEGTKPTVCIAALERSTDLICELGPANIAAHIKNLTDMMVDGLRERGAIIRSQRDDEHWSGIVAWTYPDPDRDLMAIATQLAEHDVLVTVREGSLRAAPHCYTNTTDVHRLLDALPV